MRLLRYKGTYTGGGFLWLKRCIRIKFIRYLEVVDEDIKGYERTKARKLYREIESEIDELSLQEVADVPPL